ncbi:helix-turn-helix domain-containing protein [Scatolibacter rhodanostii]|uniref:helix-turn-helix domain-containing protein n=1 Tax=Scatolibacter rhodanostii TaxID=2014781 RepID=UPI000C08D13E|nr:AraC family transcriptional regulator [Scatolibacter rhodanostii]
MEPENYLCQIPCNSLPFVNEADFKIALKSVVHPSRTMDSHVLIYILSGKMQVIEDGIAYTLTPGTLFFLKQGVHHWGEEEFEHGTSWYYVHFYMPEPAENSQLLENGEVHNHRNLSPLPCHMNLPKLLQLPPNHPIKEEMKKLIQAFESCNEADFIRVNLSLWEILLQSVQWQNRKRSDKNSELVHKVSLFVEQNVLHNFSAQELEEEMELTYKHMGTLFKKQTGRTIKEYQTILRMKRAKKLLSETEKSIADIAAVLGFYDAFYFSKIFKKKEGKSPSQFRDSYIPKI